MLSYVEFWIGAASDRPLGNGGRVVLSASSRKAADDFRAAPSATVQANEMTEVPPSLQAARPRRVILHLSKPADRP
jgi:hypothetical protein